MGSLHMHVVGTILLQYKAANWPSVDTCSGVGAQLLWGRFGVVYDAPEMSARQHIHKHMYIVHQNEPLYFLKQDILRHITLRHWHKLNFVSC